MTPLDVLEELKTVFVKRLKFKPERAAGITMATTLPKGVEGSLGFDSLDFIELSLALEDCFGIVIDDPEDLAPHFQSMETLAQFICSKASRV